MSSREHFEHVESHAINGDCITLHRDNDTKSYRLFVNKGYRKGQIGYHIESCMCCDLSIDDLRKLNKVIRGAIEGWVEWPDYE